MDRARFRQVAEQAMASLPAEFRERLGNVELIVQEEPTDEQIESVGLDPEEDTLYGLYEGTPLPERPHDWAMALPDRIILFYRPLVRDCRTAGELREEIRDTVIHEVAHFFGMDDDEIEDLGY